MLTFFAQGSFTSSPAETLSNRFSYRAQQLLVNLLKSQ